MKRVLCILLLWPALSSATTCKCVDQGKVIYSAAPCCDNAQAMYFRDDQAITQGKLAVHMDMAHSYRTRGTVNGKPVSFVVDTGASRTAISGQVADAAGVRGCAIAGYSSTANGVVSACLVTVPEITFGEFHVKNLVVSILPNLTADAHAWHGRAGPPENSAGRRGAVPIQQVDVTRPF